MNKVTIDRELLEQVASELEHDNDRYMLGRELRKVLDAPRHDECDEPVAWMNPYGGVLQKRITWLERETFTIPLYTAPQPNAGVVMPERQECDDGYPSDDWLIASAWNACLDEFARLNGKEVGRE